MNANAASSAAPSGLDPSTFSPTVRPQDDFFRYVNGPWLETHEIPADRAADGHFHKLRDLSEERTRDIIQEAPADSLMGALYRSFMDEERCDALGVEPLTEDLGLIEAAETGEELAVAAATLARTGVTSIITSEVWADSGDPDRMMLWMGQGGISLPDEAYYRDDVHAEVRATFVAHVDRMAALTSGALVHGSFTGESVLAFEARLASHHWDIVKTREAELTYNPTSVDAIAASSPGLPWRTYFSTLGLPAGADAQLVAAEPSFFTALGELWPGGSNELPLGEWKSWLRWRVVTARAAYLTREISRANFDFYGTALTGATEQRERWKRGVALVDGALGEAVGREYVARHFPPGHKAEMDVLVANLIEAYRESITALAWMTDATKEKALAKLDQFVPKIGYPNKWRDYSGLEIRPDDLVGNVRRANAFNEDYDLAKLTKPTDRDEWWMMPQVVNAYYNPNGNEIVFPAAILQPPFFDPDADDAVNYGAIGSVIGHEIGHGFDDQGSKYDGTGKLLDWWTDEDRAGFSERTTALIAQYDAYTPRQLEGTAHHVNGALTIGENIGDISGVEIGLKAYAIALGGDLDSAPVIDGFTGVQRYFLGYAMTEQTKRRNEALITQISSDPHAPEEFRINGVVRNIAAWYEAFEVGPDDALWLDAKDRVSIW